MPIILRGGTAVTAPPSLILAAGEPAAERDTGQVKIGDGATAWPALPYVGSVAPGLLDGLDGRLDVIEALGPLATDVELEAETAARLAAAPLRDTLANLGATNPVAAVGRLVIATDSSPQIFAIGDGATAWLSLPKYEQVGNLQRASVTASTTTTASSTAFFDRAGLTVTFTVGAVPWIVEAHEPFLYTASAAGLPVVAIRDASNVVTAQTLGVLGSVNGSFYYGSVGDVVERITVPGTYTRKVSIQYLLAPAGGALVVGNTGAAYVSYILAKPER